MDDTYISCEIIQVNAAECRGCGKIIVSRYTHDFKQHVCTKLAPNMMRPHFFVDGGRSYIRRGWGYGMPSDHYIERSVTYSPHKLYGWLPGPHPLPSRIDVLRARGWVLVEV